MGEASSLHPINLFISYAHKDDPFRKQLGAHLSTLRSQGIISDWHDGRILPGQDWNSVIDEALNKSRIILILISADFLHSEYCYAKEMGRAIERHDAGEAVVIPIILRACIWEYSRFGKLQALPKGAKPIQNWKYKDEAWLDVVRGLLQVIEALNNDHPVMASTDFPKPSKSTDSTGQGGVGVGDSVKAEQHPIKEINWYSRFAQTLRKSWVAQTRGPNLCCSDLVLLSLALMCGLTVRSIWQNNNPIGSAIPFPKSSVLQPATPTPTPESTQSRAPAKSSPTATPSGDWPSVYLAICKNRGGCEAKRNCDLVTRDTRSNSEEKKDAEARLKALENEIKIFNCR